MIVDQESCQKLLPLVTVYGMGQLYAGTININTASTTVLMTLDDDLTQELAAFKARLASLKSVQPGAALVSLAPQQAAVVNPAREIERLN